MRTRDGKTLIAEAAVTGRERVFSIAAVVVSFCALYFVIFSALPFRGVRILGLLPGLAAACTFLFLRQNRIAVLSVSGAALIYTVLCVAINFNAFAGGAVRFANDVVQTSNANLHRGMEYIISDAVESPTGDFLFSSVAGMWLALGVSALGFKSGIIAALSGFVLAVWLCLGLVPAWYAAAAIAAAIVMLFVSVRKYRLKSALCALLGAFCAIGAISATFAYKGSEGMRDFRLSLRYGADKLLYGKDSLPEGNLLNAANMRSSGDERLKVTLTSGVRTLYLKGFVGGELKGNRFMPTDRNAYVENDYQGLLEYVSDVGIPITQYSVYSSFTQSSQLHTVKIENRGANAAYVYTPYSVNSYSVGEAYYDMNVRANVFTPDNYEVKVYSGDQSSERLTQAGWVFGDALSQTDGMRRYLALEGAYRSFVYGEYCRITDADRTVITKALDKSANSIRTAAQVIRHYFTDNFIYTDGVDGVNDNFLAEFYGGKIQNANAAYFAAAAVYAFRAYGFPARYAEGYLVNPVESTDNEVIVTGRSSHAWAEVYFDGMGWLPIDVTPTFFVEDNETKPDVPDVPPIDPEKPVEPENPDNTDKPDEPEKKPFEPESEGEKKLLLALKILIPVFSVVLIISLGISFLAIRRIFVLKNKRRKLQTDGEEFGRGAYRIIVNDLRHFGGFTDETFARYGISQHSVKRFTEIVEKAVYGGYKLDGNEKNYVIRFIGNTAAKITEGKSELHRLRFRYVYCIGL